MTVIRFTYCGLEFMAEFPTTTDFAVTANLVESLAQTFLIHASDEHSNQNRMTEREMRFEQEKAERAFRHQLRMSGKFAGPCVVPDPGAETEP